MNTPIKPPLDEKEKQIADRQRRREQQFGGQLRWAYTSLSVISALCAIGLSKTDRPRAVIALVCAVVLAFWARTNWRNWQKKTEAEKTPLLLMPKLQIKEISVPFSREDFKHNAQATPINAALAFAGLTFIPALIAIVRPQFSLGMRLFMVALGLLGLWMLIYCGRRFLHGLKTLICPGCKDILSTQQNQLLETGCCRKCGRQVLVD